MNKRDPEAHDFYCDQVLSGKAEFKTVLETDRVLAFHHTRPMFETHVVVIPKQHINDLTTLGDDSLLLEILHTIQTVASHTLRDSGVCKVVTNLGEYQESKHLHWHVISRPL